MSESLEQARAYVTDLRGRGFPDPEIARMLRAAGWSDDQIAALVGLPVPPVPASVAGRGPVAPPEGSSGLATAALVLGLISIFLFPLALITGPLAVVLGVISLSRRRPGANHATVGIILATLAWLIMLVLGPLLAAVFLPVFMRAREKAEQASCLSNVKQLTLSLNLYQAENNDYTPPADRWLELVGPYVPSDQLYLCPSDHRPAKHNQIGRDTSYTMSEALGGLSVSALAAPSELGCLFDGTRLAGDRSAAVFVHNKGLNLGYLDGHAGWLSESEFARAALAPWESPPLAARGP